MASTKLSAEDKKAIVKLYQEVGQTAATVAEQYGVSVSTISRLLKSELPAETYEALVRQKRGGGETKSKKRTSRKKPVSKLKKEAAKPEVVEPAVVDEPAEVEVEIEVAAEPSEEEKSPTRSRRRRTRSSSEKKKRPISRRKAKEPEEEAVTEEVTTEEPAPEVVEVEAAVEVEETSSSRKKPVRRTRPRLKKAAEVDEASEEATAEEATVETSEPTEVADEEQESKPRRRTRRRTRARAVAEEAPEVVDVTEEAAAEPQVEADDDSELGLDDLTDTLDSGDEDFDDAFDDDDDLEDDDDGSNNITSLRRRSSGADVVQIQPLSEANLSRMLYLVIDRTADLITMPMVFFSDLGELPEEEERKKTLPVFENHRVARRFSQRNQRVIKVPDGELISKTASWLEAKGITRCLLDGQVYSLESADR